MKCYEIKKGKHYPKGIHFGITFYKRVAFRCYFDESCLYDHGSGENYDINKLFGFSTTYFHHKQSGRVGWRCLDGENIQLVTYSYNDWFRDGYDSNVIGIVKPNEEFMCTVEDRETHYRYTFDKGKEFNEDNDAKLPDWFFFHYILYPYFGGNLPAPHDMKIYLERL